MTVRYARSGLDKRQDVSAELVRLGLGKSMRSARMDLEFGALDDLGALCSGRLERHDLVIVAMDDQCRLVDLLEVISVVDLGEFLDAVVEALCAAQHALQPEGFAQALVDLGTGAVEAVERH